VSLPFPLPLALTPTLALTLTLTLTLTRTLPLALLLTVIPPLTRMLLDCGEGTLGQLTALFGVDGAAEVSTPNPNP